MQESTILPKVIRIEPTSICNFRCRHCTTGLRINKSVGTMDRKTFDLIFDKIKNLHFKAAVLYHGGEPLINKDIFYFVDKMKTISEQVKFVSNGSLLNDENIKKILNSSLDLIEFSFDGRSAEENNSIRQGSDFHAISAQIKKLLEERNESKSKLKVFISNVTFREGDDPDIPSPPKYLLDAFSSYKDVTIRSYYAIFWPGYPVKNNTDELPLLNSYCDHVENVMTIRWNGDVVPCCYDLISKDVLGNILTDSLEDIWNGNKINYFREKIKQRNPPELCKGCNVLYKQRYISRNEVFKNEIL